MVVASGQTKSAWPFTTSSGSGRQNPTWLAGNKNRAKKLRAKMKNPNFLNRHCAFIVFLANIPCLIGRASMLPPATKSPTSDGYGYRALNVRFVFGNWLPSRFREEGPIALCPILSEGLPLSLQYQLQKNSFLSNKI